MGLIIVISIAIIVGWIASLILRTETELGVVLNVATGIVGALIAGFATTALTGAENLWADNFGTHFLLASLLGAVALLAVVNIFRRRFGR